MARIETDPNYTTPTFPRATAATDLFKKEDVQALAAAMSTHDHTSGKGLILPASAIPPITSAMIVDGTIEDADISGVGGNKVNWAATIDSSIPGSKIQNNSLDHTKLASGAAVLAASYLATAGNSTTSASSVAIPGASVAWTMVDSYPVLLLFSLPIYNATGSFGAYIQLKVDAGAANPFVYVNLASGALTQMAVGVFLQQGLAPGAHTVALHWQTTGGTLTQNGAAYTSLVVLELRG